jgi:signal transduction histidine kinase
MRLLTRPVVRSQLPEDQPVRYALLSALVYVGIATAYILLSGRIAAAFASSLEQLQTIEAYKGIGFVFTTGVLLFLISLGFWRKMRAQRDLLVRSEHKAVAAMYSATLAHDLNNLLMGLSGLLEAIRLHSHADPDLAQLGDSVERSIQRLAPFAKRIAASAKSLPSAARAEEVDLSVALPQSLEIIRKHPDVRTCALEIEPVPALKLTLDRELFDQAVLNLVVNAAQAAGPRGAVKIRAAVDGEARAAALEVHDSGPGIPPEKLDVIFQPGYTTRDGGIGLGLLTVQAFAASCRARLEVDRSPLGGALFRLILPLGREREG